MYFPNGNPFNQLFLKAGGKMATYFAATNHTRTRWQ